MEMAANPVLFLLGTVWELLSGWKSDSVTYLKMKKGLTVTSNMFRGH